MSSEHYFLEAFPPDVLLRFTAIHLLEALSKFTAPRLRGRHWRGLRIMVHCDNFSIVSSLNSGRVQDKLLAACLQEIWFLAAVHEFEIRTCHPSTSENRGADLLSCWHLNSSFQNEFFFKLMAHSACSRFQFLWTCFRCWMLFNVFVFFPLTS